MKRRWLTIGLSILTGLGATLLLSWMPIWAQEGVEPGVWSRTGPEGGGADALAVSPNFPQDGVAFGGGFYSIRQSKTGLGIFKSTDSGLSWTLSATTNETDTQITGVEDVAFSPDFGNDETVFAATSSGLFTSTDAGTTWAQVDGVGSLPYGVTSVAVAPDYALSGHVMASDGTDLHISENRGVTWTTQSTLGFVGPLAYSPYFANDQIAFAGSEALWQTVNGGLTWTKTLSQSVRALALSPEFATDDTLFAGALDRTLYRSTDRGTTWLSRTISTTASTVNALAVSPAYLTDTTIFAGCQGGLYRSSDGGTNWESVASYPGPAAKALALSPDWPTNPTMLVGTPAGVYRTEDGGTTWARSGFTPLGISVLEGTQQRGRLFAGSRHQGLFQSADEGAHWEPAGLYGKTFIDVAEAPDYPSDPTIFGSVVAGAGLGLYRSDDGGQNWTHLRSGDHPGGHWALSPSYAQDGTVYVTGGSGKAVLRSTNRGVTWTQVGTWPAGVYDSPRFVLLSPDYPADATVWAAGDGFWRLSPGATTWVSATLPVPNAEINDIALSPNFRHDRTLLATGYGQAEGSYTHHYTVFRSTDAGETWVTATLAFSNTTPLVAVAFSPNFEVDQTAYVISQKQLFRSSDGGEHWVAVGAPPDGALLHDVRAHGYGRVSVATGTGVWQYATDWEEVVVNGGFEADGGWGFPDTPLPASTTNVFTHTGARAARIGFGAGSETPTQKAYSSVRQTLQVPRDTLTATLHFYYLPHTDEEVMTAAAAPVPAAETVSTLEDDLQYAMILTKTRKFLFWELVDADRWLSRTIDLSIYAGQSITLHFGVFNNGEDGHTGMYLDDVSLLTRRIRPADLTEQVYLPVVLRAFQ